MLKRRVAPLAIILISACTLLIEPNARVQPAIAQGDNPFAPTQLIDIATVLGKAVQCKGVPDQTPLAIVANDVAPFWSAVQSGSQRAASEIGIQVIFHAPI